MVDLQESTTAKLCSFARAFHSNFGEDKIFDDYLAYDMMEKELYEEIGQLIENQYQLGLFDPARGFVSGQILPDAVNYFAPIPLSRIAFAEQELQFFSLQHGRCQYVICGAGMDTFAFRNKNPNILVFELDHPDTQRYKLQRIGNLEWSIPENVHFTAVDFLSDDIVNALECNGFDPELPTFCAILGVTYYLSLPVFEQTIRQIAALSKTGGKIMFDYPDETTFQKNSVPRIKYLSMITKKLGEPMVQGFSFQNMKDALEQNGFSIENHMTPEKIQREYFANRTDQQRAFENIHFILAKKGNAHHE